MNRTTLNRSGGRKLRRTRPRLIRAAICVLAAGAITVLAGCPTPTQKEFTYTATVAVTGAVAGGVTVDVVDPVGGGTGGPVGVATFPWTYPVSDSVDFDSLSTVEFVVDGTLNPGETFSVTVTYREEHYTDPVTHTLFSESVSNATAAPEAAVIQGAVVLPYVKTP